MRQVLEQNSKPTAFQFRCPYEAEFGLGDFVSVQTHPSSEQTHVAQIHQMSGHSDYIQATAEIVGSAPSIPFRPGMEVEKSTEEMVRESLNLPEEGLHIGDISAGELVCPLNLSADKAREQHFAIYGRTGSGKSYTTGVLIEELLNDGQNVVVIDPHGEYSTLQVDRDGQPSDYLVKEYSSEEYQTSENTDGSLNQVLKSPCEVADGGATVLNLKGLDGEEQREVVSEVLSELYLARKKGNFPPTRVVVDEAHHFIGKTSSNRCDILQSIATGGRKFEFTLTLSSQRPASIDTDARTQMQVLFLHKLTDETDVQKAIRSAEGIDSSWEEGVQMLNVGECIITGSNIEAPTFADIRQRKTIHDGGSDTIGDTLEDAELSRAKNRLEAEWEVSHLSDADEVVRAFVQEREQLSDCKSKVQLQEEKISQLCDERESLKEEIHRLSEDGTSDDTGEVERLIGLFVDTWRAKIRLLNRSEQEVVHWFTKQGQHPSDWCGSLEDASLSVGDADAIRRSFLTNLGILNELESGRYELCIYKSVQREIGEILSDGDVEDIPNRIIAGLESKGE